MEAALKIEPASRGLELLLYHCVSLGRWDEARLPATARLEQALGRELARLLLAALTAPQGRRAVSSSP
jgi:hypothetical protein